MTKQTFDPRVMKSRDVLIAEADDIDLAIAGRLENDPRSMSSIMRSTTAVNRTFAVKTPHPDALAA